MISLKGIVSIKGLTLILILMIIRQPDFKQIMMLPIKQQ